MADGADLSDNEHRATASELLERWRSGESKSSLEVEYWGDSTSHGKAFTAYVKKWLGIDTERRSAQSERVAALESKLRLHGISPDDDESLSDDLQLLAASREAALAALRIYNDPTAGFRTEAFITLMVVAWNALLQAILHRRDLNCFQVDDEGSPVLVDGRPKALDTHQLADLALSGNKKQAMRANLDFFLKLRHLIAHRYLPAVDVAVVSEAQAFLLNLEKVLVENFGQEARLGRQLSVPLQLAEFYEPAGWQSMKDLQAHLPPDVLDFLSRHRKELAADVVRSSEYALQIFLVPVAANHEKSADAVVRFVKPGDVTPELEEALQQMVVVTKPKRIPVASDDLMRPSDVVSKVAPQLPYRFTIDTHTRCWRHFKVRPRSDEGDPAETDSRHCVYDSLSRQYGYKEAWVKKLVRDLSDPDTFEAVVGSRPYRRRGNYWERVPPGSP